MDEIYSRVASQFYNRIQEVWETEDTLKAEYQKNFKHLPFSRTDNWQLIVHKIFRDVWLEYGPEVKAEPTGFDKMVVMRLVHPKLDYNLFSQVLLNMQNYLGMGYALRDATQELEDLKNSWPKESKLDPFQKGAKMAAKEGGDLPEEEKKYNKIISALRAIKIISGFDGGTSFRVSPKGSTPAFADSQNLSMIGTGGDKYLRTLPTMCPYYLTWEVTPHMASVCTDEIKPGYTKMQAMGIPYPFYSKSGGEMLQEVLFARYLVHQVFGAVDITQKQCIQIPRKNSLLVITSDPCPELEKLEQELQQQLLGTVKFWKEVRN